MNGIYLEAISRQRLNAVQNEVEQAERTKAKLAFTQKIKAATNNAVLVVFILILLCGTHLVDASPHQRRSSNQQPSTNGAATNGHRAVNRPGQCVIDDQYANCFMCGRLADDPRVYTDCCNGDLDIVEFCQRMLS